MSYRSLSNQDLVLNNLTINGKLTEVNPEEETHDDLSLNNLDVAQVSNLNTVTYVDLSGNDITCTDLSCNNLQVQDTSVFNGACTFNGALYGNIGNAICEVATYHVNGNASSTTGTITLASNSSGTAQYTVLSSFYYGYGGSGGTYNYAASATAITCPILISEQTSSSFKFYFTKSTGDNINIYVNFMIVYSPVNTFPVAY